MTAICNKIRTAIIDDDEEFSFSLKEHLSFFPEIEIVGCASKYKQARNILLNERLDLIFLDIEMPGKNGFELLHEIRQTGKDDFSVIFHTAYDKYVIQALREYAFDYILKPVKPEELKNAIDRFKQQRKAPCNPIVTSVTRNLSEITSLPTTTGIRFIDKNSILLFQWSSGIGSDKKSWNTVLTDRSEIKLCTSTSAKDILDFIGEGVFIQINPSLILNINFLAAIEFSSRTCQLFPPFSDIILIASRSNMTEIREKFDVL